jgi:hypothetical protein
MGHWILFYIMSNTLYFIDSLGYTPQHYAGNIFQYFDNYNNVKEIVINKGIQNPNSYTCGGFVLYFAYYLSIGVGVTAIMNCFNYRDLNRNDIIIEDFIYSMTGQKGCNDFFCNAKTFFTQCNRLCKCSNH